MGLGGLMWFYVVLITLNWLVSSIYLHRVYGVFCAVFHGLYNLYMHPLVIKQHGWLGSPL